MTGREGFMKKKTKVLLALGMTAAGYSILPSQAGKIRQKARRQSNYREELLECSGKRIYLTFDDGPHPIYTEKLLNLLAEYGIRATFFTVGRFAEENPGLIRRMQEEGHSIGMHSYQHKSAMVQTAAAAAEDFRQCLSVMEKLKIRTRLYRPPWGHVNWFTLYQIRRAGMKKVLWDVMAEDWEPNTDADILCDRLLSRTRPGDIICLHDRQADRREDSLSAEDTEKQPPEEMLKALEKAVPIWLEEGYSFEVIR